MARNRNLLIIETKPEWCKGCGICVAFCPKQCLGLDVHDRIRMLRPDDCIKCGQCEQRCPDFAIFLKEKDEVNDEE